MALSVFSLRSSYQLQLKDIIIQVIAKNLFNEASHERIEQNVYNYIYMELNKDFQKPLG